MSRRSLTCLVTLYTCIALSLSVRAETGVTPETVTLGMSNALHGPAAKLGTGVKKGAMVYFDKINRAGGVHGRQIELISYDDGYEPKNTVANTEKLIEQDKVFALFGYVGTPTSKAILPTLRKTGIPYVGPFTGAEFLRNPVKKNIFNIRGSYFDEAEAQVAYLTDQGIKKIGMFIQDDGYGLAVKGGVARALRDRGLKIHGEGRYTRNTTDVDEGLAQLKQAAPEAISMVGTYKAMAAFIKKARAQGFDPEFLNVSFVGTAALIEELGGAEDVYITQVVPSPTDSTLAIVQQYQADMRAAGHERFDYVSLEGYLDAVVLVEGLKAAGKNLTRDSFIQGMESLNKDIGGLTISYGPDDHQALSEIYITQIRDGKAVEL